MKKTIQDIKEEFFRSGISIAGWARENNFSPDLVYQILKKNRIPVRGESHKIAVRLGLKEGSDNSIIKFNKIEESIS